MGLEWDDHRPARLPPGVMESYDQNCPATADWDQMFTWPLWP